MAPKGENGKKLLIICCFVDSGYGLLFDLASYVFWRPVGGFKMLTRTEKAFYGV
ncbi:MAG: hypothetical protein CM15mP59_4000 [Flavobacteriaceae bacterium]|nr:MAG: hypothetical protein CM15mP59_4000 [Flavobacteriaceae bacterium]